MTARYVPRVGDRVVIRGVVNDTDGEWAQLRLDTGGTWALRTERLRPDPQPVGEPYWVVEILQAGSGVVVWIVTGTEQMLSDLVTCRRRFDSLAEAREAARDRRRMMVGEHRVRVVRVTRRRVGGGS